MPMETLSEAMERLAAAGYCDAFRAERGGFRAIGTQCLHEPESLVIEEIVRFEGASDPGDEAILFALRCDVHGTKGTYVVTFGPSVDSLTAAIHAIAEEARGFTGLRAGGHGKERNDEDKRADQRPSPPTAAPRTGHRSSASSVRERGSRGTKVVQ